MDARDGQQFFAPLNLVPIRDETPDSVEPPRGISEFATMYLFGSMKIRWLTRSTRGCFLYFPLWQKRAPRMKLKSGIDRFLWLLVLVMSRLEAPMRYPHLAAWPSSSARCLNPFRMSAIYTYFVFPCARNELFWRFKQVPSDGSVLN